MIFFLRNMVGYHHSTMGRGHHYAEMGDRCVYLPIIVYKKLKFTELFSNTQVLANITAGPTIVSIVNHICEP